MTDAARAKIALTILRILSPPASIRLGHFQPTKVNITLLDYGVLDFKCLAQKLFVEARQALAGGVSEQGHSHLGHDAGLK
jgi:hypothetical protein